MSMTFATDVVIGSSNNLDLQGMKVFYGTCSTAADTSPKVVTCAGFTSGDLAAGTIIFVKFTNTATTTAVASLQMNVNSTGDKNIKKLYNGSISNITTIGEIQKNIPLIFAYNGTYWVLLGANYNTTYSLITPSAAIAIPSGSATYTMSGMTATHVLLEWGFSSSPENSPPCDLSWTTASGSFTITNNGGTSSETIKPVFIKPSGVTATAST